MTSRSWVRNLFASRTPRTIRKAPARQRLGLERLEQRIAPVVTPQLLTGGILDIGFGAANDMATISVAGPNIDVFDGTTHTDFAATSVNAINAHGSGDSNQAVTFSSAVTLPGALTVTGLTNATLNGTYMLQSANLAASGTIDIAAGATLSTRQIASGGDPLTAHSISNSGAVVLDAPHLSVDNGAHILANADSGFQSADVTLHADDEANLNFVLGLTGFQNKQTSTSVNIGSATIKGKDVTVTGLSSTAKTVNLTQNLTDSRAVVFADVTGNGRLDMIVGNFDGPVQLYLNNGTADPFNGVAPISLTDSDPTVALAVADVNGDGLPDLVVGNAGAPTRLYLNSGSKTNPFGGVTGIDLTPANSPTTSVALVDVNGDGRADLIVGNNSLGASTTTPSQLYLNTGNPLNPFGGIPLALTGADYTTSLAVADVNGDGHPDLVVGQVGSGSTRELTRLFLNSGNAANPFSSALINIGGLSSTTSTVVLADVNGDGHPDLIVGNNGAPTQLYLNSGNTSNSFGGVTPETIGGNDPTTSLAVADVNGDGHPDLIVGNSGVPTRLYLNTGSATSPFQGATVENITAPADDTRSVALGDLNGDGHPDLFVGLNGDFPRVYLNNNAATPFSTAASTVNPEPELSYQANESAVFDFHLGVSAILAHAESDITIGSGATIAADVNATLNAQAIANAQSTVIGVFLGGSYADSEATANVSVGTGTTITAGGFFDMEALTQNTVSLFTLVPTDASPGTIAFSYEKARSTSTADIAAGASVTAGAATIDAHNTNLFSNKCTSLGLQANGGASLGFAAAISDTQSAATASVHGSVRTTNDTTVDAESVNTNNVTGAIAAILSALQDKLNIGGATTKLGNFLASKSSSYTQTIGNSIISGMGGAPGLAVSAGVAVAESVNTANAFVGSQGGISAGGNVTISARAEDNFKSYAAGGASEAKFAAVGGGVDFSHTTNQANAYLDAGATVDAGLLLHVVADADIPNPVQLFGVPFVPPADNTGTNNTNGTDRVNSGYNTGPSTAQSVLDWLEGLEQYATAVVTGRLGSIGTTYAQSEGEVEEGGGGIGIAGGVNIFTVDNTSNAYIGNGAMVNQNLRGPNQDVQVEADTNIETINLAGQASALGFKGAFGGAAGGQGGVGGSIEVISYNNTAHAYIDDNAKVSAGRDINVNANTFNYILSLAQAGAASEALAVTGAIIFFNLHNDTEGWIEDGATVNAGRDLQVTAGNTLTDIVGTGGLALAENVGVGISGSYNNLINTTRAFIGDANGTIGPLGSVTAGHDINVQADSHQEIVSVGIAASLPSSPLQESSSSDSHDGVQPPVPEESSFGIGLSGDVGLNFLAEDTEAFIQGTGRITAGNQLNVNATDTSLFVGAAGSVAFGNDVGIGGSVVLDNLHKTTRAFTQDVTILAGDIVLSATSTATLVAVAAGGGASKESAAVAGSVNLNFLSNDTEAYLGNGTTATTTTGGVAIDAANTLNTVTVAGTAAVSLGSVAVGAALDLGIYNTTVLAFIGGTANVNAAGNIAVFASTNEVILSLGAALAVSTEDGVGASGSGAAQVLTDDVEAYLGSGAVVQTTGSLFVDADDNTDLLVIAGSAGVGTSAGVGLSAGTGIVSRTVKAYIGNNAQVSALGNGSAFIDPEGSSLTGTGVVIDATTEDENLVFAAGVGGGADAGVAASAVVDTETSDTEAFIGQSAMVTTSQSVQVHAEEDTNNITVAGAFAGSGGGSVGAAADVQVISRTVKAYIDSSANVAAGANVVLSAVAPEKIIAVAAGLGVSTDVLALAGSATVFTLTNNTQAFIGNGATVSAQGSISLSALSDRTFIPTAGALAVALSLDEFGIGIGASDSTLVAHDTTLAYIGTNAHITALGSDSLAPVDVLIGRKDSSGNEETTPLHGLSLAAVSYLFAVPVTAAGGGALIAGLAGSANVDDLTEVTQAYIGASTTVNGNNAGAGSAQDVNLLASDHTTIDSVAGSLAGGGVGVGAGADVAVVSKNTEAYIGPSATVNAAEHVKASAFSQEQLVSASGSASGGGVGVAGAADVYVLTLSTLGYIGDHAHVSAGGNVVATADDETSLLMIAGSLSVGGGDGVGGSAAVPVISKTTLAYIDHDASVDALGQKGSTTVENGRFDPSYSGAAVGAPTINSNQQASTIAAFTHNRVLTPETESIQGVVIVATSTDHVTTVAASVGGGGEVGINIVGSVFVPLTTTQAYIGANAQVNQSAGNSSNAGSAQSVLVAAGADYYHLGVAGALSASSGVGVDPGAELTIAINNTDAYIDSSAQVAARRDVQVMASQGGAIVSFAAGLSVGGTGVAGSVSVFTLNNHTYAYLGNSAQVDAGGNVLVAAQDVTGSSMLDGTVALGFEGVGVGGSVGINVINKDTEAYVGPSAVVNAMAQNTTGMTVFQNGVGSDGSFSTTTANGVAVQAESSEGVFTIAASGAGGFFGALAGAVTVNIIGATTKAYIGADAQVNQNLSGADLSQSVSVAAADTATLRGIDGALAGTNVSFLAGALAGGVDVGIIRNQTSAYIDTGAQVHANANVDVFALAYKQGDSLAISAAIGNVGIAGSVSVYLIDAGVSSDALSSLSAHDGSGNTTGGYADSQANASAITSQLGGYSQMGTDQSSLLVMQGVSAGQSAVQSAAPTNQVSGTLDASVAPQGTSAYIGGSAVVSAGGALDVEANERVALQVIAGGGALGVGTIGGSVALVTVGSLTQAYIDNGATVSAGGDVIVHAGYTLAPLGSNPMVSAYGGNAGLVAALGAQVAIVTDTSTQSAHVGETSAFGSAPTSSNGGAKVLQAGQLTIEADGTRTLTARAAGGEASLGLAAGAAVGKATEQGATRAYLGDYVQVGQGSGSVNSLSLSANSTTTASADTFAIAVGIGAGSANVADAEITPSIQASLGSGSQVLVGQNILVEAASHEEATASDFGVDAGGLAVGVTLADATMSPTVKAFIDRGAQVTASNGFVTVQATHDTLNGAQSTGSASGVSAGTGEGANITATSAALIDSYIGSGATVDAGGTVTVDAAGTNLTGANANTLSVGVILNVGAIFATATAGGQVNAYVDTGAVVGTTVQQAGGLDVEAVGVHQSTANVDLRGGGAFSGLGGNATANTNPTLSAYLGNGSSVDVTGNVTVKATSTTEGHAKTTGASGGIVDVNESLANVHLTPTINAYLGSNATILAGGTITVAALHGSTPAQVSDGSFTPAQVDSNDEITFAPLAHGLQTGDTVTYAQNGNPPIGGLTDGRVYPVIKVNDTTLKLGPSFDASRVNTVNDTVVFSSPHDLQTGDQVIYENNGGTPIGGLTPGNPYLVRVIDPFTIKLVDPAQGLLTPTPFNPSSKVSNNTINLAGFSNGQAVTYRAPAPVEISPTQVSNSTINLGTDGNGNPIPSGYGNGQAVIYSLAPGGTPIGGLTPGTTYYVIVVATNEFQLSATRDSHGNPGFPLTPDPTNTVGDQFFTRTDQQAIGGLVSGQTYYVVNATAAGFQLAATPGGSALTLNATGISGTHTIGVEGIDFTSAGTGTQDLRIHLNTAGASGTYQLQGVGGASAFLNAPPGDGMATAVAISSGGGGVEIGGAAANVTSSPTVAALVGAGANLKAGGDVSITSTSYANTAADGTNSGGGFVGVGDGNATVTVDNTNSATVGTGAVIATQGNFSLLATSFNNVNASSDSSGGGFVKIGDADTTANVFPQTSVNVDPNAQITALSALVVESQTNTTANVQATSSGGGLGVGSEADADLYLGSHADNSSVASSQTTIGTGAALTAQNTTIDAVTSYGLFSNSTSSAGAFGAKTSATSVSDANDTAHVTIQAGAMITGSNSVDIEARHDNLTASAAATSDCSAAFGQAFANTEVDLFGPSRNDSSQPDMSQVDAAPGATIRTQDLQVKALVTFVFAVQFPNAEGGFIVGHYPSTSGNVTANRTIHWNADVVSLAGPSPVLIVDANGNVDPASTITPTITPTQIIVPDISNAGGTGTIMFVANEKLQTPSISNLFGLLGIANNNSAAGLITSAPVNILTGMPLGPLPTFTYERTSSAIQLLNYSAKDLVVNNIDVLNRSTATNSVDINVKDDNFLFAPFSFNIDYSFAPSLVDIENRSTTGSPNIILNGLINNPIGTTDILNASGSILSNGPQAVVRTNVLDAEAASGQIGSSASAFNAELVQSEDTHQVDRPIQATVLAGGSAYLNLTGRLRDPDFNLTQTPFTVPISSIHAGGDIVATLQQSVQNSSPGTVNFGISVFEDYVPLTTAVTTHFRPGTGNTPPETIDPGFFEGGSTLIDSTYSFADLTAGGNIKLTGVPGPQAINITGDTNINPNGPGTGNINASTNGNITLTETAGAMRVGTITSTVGNIALMVPDSAPSGDDLLLANGSSISAAQGSVTLLVGDNVILPSGSVVTANSTVLIQADYAESVADSDAGSIISIRGQILAASAMIDGGDDNDVISLTNVTPGTVTTVNTGGGVNTVNVGSIQPPTPNNGILDNIQGPLTIAGNGADTLNVDDTGSTASKSGTLTPTALTGLNMSASGITYSGLANLNITLGSGGNTFLISNTAAGTTTFLNSGTGADTVDIHATSSPTTVNTGGGSNLNTVNVESLEPTSGGVVDNIQGALTVIGTGADTMNVDDTGSTLSKTGTLTSAALTGLNMGPSGITYSGLAHLNINLGSGGNTFTVANTASGTTTTVNSGTGSDTVNVTTTSSPLTVNTQTGTDTVNVQAIGAVASINACGGNDTINVSSNAPTNTGTLSGIAALLTVNGGSGSSTTNVSDTGDSTASTSTLSGTALTSTAFGAGGSLSYSSLANLNISLGSGGNTFLISNTAAGTTTFLNSGTGADTVNVQATSSTTTVNTGGGSNRNTVNVGSLETATGGIVDHIQGPLTIVGNRADTLNADDTGSTAAKNGILTSSTLTGLNMGASGITYSGLANLNITLGSGGNTFLISNTAAGTTTFLNSGTGADTVNVQATSSTTTVNTGGGSNRNTVNVGSLEPATGGIVDHIQGPLTIVGNRADTLNADDTGSTAAKNGILTSSTLTGLNMGASGITYSGLANLNITLGSGGNTFLISNTAAGTTTFLNSGTGADTVNVQATSSTTTVNTGGGSNHNIVNVGSLEPATGGIVDHIQGALTVIGNSADTMIVDDTGSTIAKTGTLTSSTLTGLNMGASGIAYSGLANLNINLGSGGNTFFINSTAVPTTTFLNSGTGADTVDVLGTGGPTTVNTGGGANVNTVNVGSTQPPAPNYAPTPNNGNVKNIQGALTVVGNLNDTMNVDDSGSTIAKTGTLTPTTLTGMGMGPAGIAYSGLANLNVRFGSAASLTNPLSGNTFYVNGINPLTHTAADGGTDSVEDNDVVHVANAASAADFNGTLDLTRWESASVTIAGNDNGTISINTDPGDEPVIVNPVSIGGSLTPTGVLNVGGNVGTITIGQNLAGTINVTGTVGTLTIVNGSITPTGSLTLGNINTLVIGPPHLSVGQNIAGTLTVTGNIGSIQVAGGTPGTIAAGKIGTVGVYGGFGPVVATITEGGIQRQIQETTPTDPFCVHPDPTALASTSPYATITHSGTLEYINLQYFYEGTLPNAQGAALANPQLTARITNTVSTAPDQYDLSLVTFNDAAKFNLARLDAAGIAGARNVTVEGDVLTAVSSQAESFIQVPGPNGTTVPDTNPAGVYLPLDNLAGAGVRDYLPAGFIDANTIQALAFGSFTEPNGSLATGATANANEAARLLAPSTAIAQANDTYRVPFADLSTQQVGLFLGTPQGGGHFDNRNVVLVVEGVPTPNAAGKGNIITPSNVARGAVNALVYVVPTSANGRLGSSVIQSIFLHGDGGSIQTSQYIAGQLTGPGISTPGISSTGPLGDLVLPNSLGISNVTAPSIFGSISSNGDITGTIQTTGIRTDPITCATSTVGADLGNVYIATSNQGPYVTVTTISAGALSGRIISRGRLLSEVEVQKITGVVAAQGDIGTVVSSTRLGGLVSNGDVSGQIVTLGNVYGDLVIHGGLRGGRIAAEESILGNVTIAGVLDAGAALVSSGDIGSAAFGTALTVGDVTGIIAAAGDILFGHTGNLSAGHIYQDVGDTPGNPNAAVIDAIFTKNGQPLSFDLTNNLDLGGLALILAKLSALHVGSDGNLTGTGP